MRVTNHTLRTHQKTEILNSTAKETKTSLRYGARASPSRRLRMLCWLIFAAAITSAARAQTAEQSRISALEAEVADVKSELRELKSLLRDLTRPAAGTSSDDAYRRLGVDPDGSMSSRRRLGGETYSAVPAWQVHEFPAGHTCNFPASLTSLLPVAGSSSPAPTYNKAKASAEATGEMSLTQVATDWSMAEIQRMDPPIKVVHNSDCSSAPTLELPLATTVNQLTVNGINVGATLQTLPDPSASVCIRVVTSNAAYSNGYVNIFVSDASGHDHVTWPSAGNTNAGSFSKGSTVVDSCFKGFKSLRVQSSSNDGWRGAATSSIDGGSTWQNMVCTTGANGVACTGDTNSTADLYVAGGSTSHDGSSCFDGNFCTLVVA